MNRTKKRRNKTEWCIQIMKIVLENPDIRLNGILQKTGMSYTDMRICLDFLKGAKMLQETVKNDGYARSPHHFGVTHMAVQVMSVYGAIEPFINPELKEWRKGSDYGSVTSPV